MSETISGAKELCRLFHEHDIPVYAHGAPGVGKSEMYDQIAKEKKISLIDIRLGQMDPTDLLGLQAVVGHHTIWNRPAFWPTIERDGPKGILLFDEMSDAGKAVQSAAYQIILNRRAGPHVLPPGWYPCAAGNRRQDRAAAQTLSTALANRFAHIDIEPTVDDWVLWANRNDVDPLVVGFLKFRPELLHKMDGADLRAFPTPRSWARVSKVARAPSGVRLRAVTALVGQGAAIEFEAVYIKSLELPSLEDVTKYPTRTPIPTEASSKYAMSSMLARYADEENLTPIAKYIGRPNFGREFEVVTMLDMARRDETLCNTEAWQDWAIRNQDITL